MSLILKQEPANTIATPPAGKSTLFVTDTSTMAVKSPDGNVTTFPTVQGSNTQVFFNDSGAINGNANLTFDKSTAIMTLAGNLVATNVKTDNLLYANGNPWDLQQPAGSNTAIQFNDNGSFGGTSAFIFDNVTNAVTATGTIYASNIGGGNTVTANFFSGTLTTGNQPNITTVGTLGNLSVTSNISAGNVKTDNLLYSNGSPWDLQQPAGSNTQVQFNNNNDFGATSNFAYDTANSVLTVSGNIVAINTLHAGNVSGGNLLTANFANISSNLVAANIYANSGTVGASLLTGTLTTGTQPNITSVGNLTGLTVNGIITGNQISAGNTTANSQVLFNNGNIITGTSGLTFDIVTSALTVNGTLNSGNATLGNYASANFLGGTLTTASNAQPNITSVGSLTSLTVNGGANVYTLTANGNISGGNVSGGNLVSANFVQGTLITAAQPNITSVGSLSSLTVTGNASAGNVGGGNLVSANYVAGVLTTASQPNITGVGTLTSLSVTGNVAGGNLTTVGQVVATGNVTGNFFIGNGSQLTGIDATAIQNGNSNVRVLANANVTISSTGNANIVVVTGTGVNVAGTLNTTGNATVGNLIAGAGTGGNITGANLVSANFFTGTLTTAAQPNITSVGTLTSLAVTGNISAGNVSATTFTGALSGAATTAGTVTTNAQPNITSTGTLTSLSVTGNISAGNVSATTFTGALSGAATSATTAGTVTTAAQSNITSVGTLSSLAVTGNISAGNVSATTFTGALSGAATTAGTVTTAAQGNITSVGTLSSVAVTGNATAGNVYANSGTIGASLLTGTLTTVAQPNITSTGTLTSLTVTGTATAGNLSTGGTLSVTGNANVGNIGAAAGVFTTVAGSLTTAAQPNVTSVGTLSSLAVTGNVAAGNLTTTGVLSVTGTGLSSIAGNLDMTSNNIVNLATPVNSTDAATKQYVDDVAQGLHTHDSCNAATQTTLATISGGTVTYSNGTDGVGATLTTTGSYTTIDGVTLSNGMRILVKNEANTAHNGIYDRTSTTVLTRSSDFDTPVEMAGGDFTFVTAGTLYDNTGWVMPDPVTTVGTTAVVWVQFSGAGTYTAGTGLTLTGSQFSVNASQTQVTSVGTLGSLAVTGNISAGNVSATTFTGALSGAATSATTAGTVTTAAQGNITSVGTLTGLGVNGTVTAVNFTSNTGVFAGSGANLTTLNASNVSSGTLAQARLANSSVTLGSTALTLGSTVTTVAGLSSVTSTTFVGALTGAATTAGSATTAGTVTTAAQPNITSVGTLTGLTLSGTLTGAVQIGTGTATHFGTTLTTGANSTAGTITGNWSLSAGSRLNATYADLAEKYTADADYEPGTVLVFGGNEEVTISTESDSFRVAGVVTTNPAYTMNNECEGEHVATIALQGRVPAKVIGPIVKGDLLVSTGNGYATANNIARAGTIIGKSLENFSGASGIIEVAVGRF